MALCGKDRPIGKAAVKVKRAAEPERAQSMITLYPLGMSIAEELRAFPQSGLAAIAKKVKSIRSYLKPLWSCSQSE